MSHTPEDYRVYRVRRILQSLEDALHYSIRAALNEGDTRWEFFADHAEDAARSMAIAARQSAALENDDERFEGISLVSTSGALMLWDSVTS